jgi:S1-C subfamily serine protease
VENTFVNDVPELQEQIGKYKPGDLVNIIIQRKGKKKSLTLTLRNENGNTKIINNKQNEEKSIIFGAHLKDINEKKLRQLGLTNGVEVISINEGKFEEIGIEKGFIITHINKKAVESKIKLIATIKDKKGGILIEGQYPNGVRGYFGMGL